MAISDGQIYVDYSHVTNVEQALEDADNQIKQVLTDLEDIINPLRASWSGASESEYTTVQNRWNSDLAQMNGLLATYRNTLSEMSINYNSTDNGLAHQWSSIT